MIMCTIDGLNLFDLFPEDIEIYKQMLQKLGNECYKEFIDDDDRPISHPMLRKASRQLTQFKPYQVQDSDDSKQSK